MNQAFDSLFPVAGEQRPKFDRLAAEVFERNPWYAAKWRQAGFSASRLPTFDHLDQVPFTLKSELVDDQLRNGPFGSNLTAARSDYVRMHQTSGTTGQPLRWLDTAKSWQWWLDCWKQIYQAAGVTPDDRVFLAFSFGPFIGFWTAFEAATQAGTLALPGGGLSTEQRLETILQTECTVVVCTPTYALRLAEVARHLGVDLPGSAVRLTLHAGEPGASVPNVKARLEQAFGARAVDHVGATEIGAWGFSCGIDTNLHILEREFVAEVVEPGGEQRVTPDEEGTSRGELVLSNLGRTGSPLIRYRTGDYVELCRRPCACGRATAYLPGGVQSRVDDMVVVRGINVYPSAIENLVREFPDVVEFQGRIDKREEMAELVLQIEADGDAVRVAKELGDLLHRNLSLRPQIEVVPPGTLPRYELKARRFQIGERGR